MQKKNILIFTLLLTLTNYAKPIHQVNVDSNEDRRKISALKKAFSNLLVIPPRERFEKIILPYSSLSNDAKKTDLKELLKKPVGNFIANSRLCVRRIVSHPPENNLINKIAVDITTKLLKNELKFANSELKILPQNDKSKMYNQFLEYEVDLVLNNLLSNNFFVSNDTLFDLIFLRWENWEILEKKLKNQEIKIRFPKNLTKTLDAIYNLIEIIINNFYYENQKKSDTRPLLKILQELSIDIKEEKGILVFTQFELYIRLAIKINESNRFGLNKLTLEQVKSPNSISRNKNDTSLLKEDL